MFGGQAVNVAIAFISIVVRELNDRNTMLERAIISSPSPEEVVRPTGFEPMAPRLGI
jgi:hypothetical protein